MQSAWAVTDAPWSVAGYLQSTFLLTELLAKFCDLIVLIGDHRALKEDLLLEIWSIERRESYLETVGTN